MNIKKEFDFYKSRFNYSELNICEIILRKFTDNDIQDKDKLRSIYDELIDCCSQFNVITILKNNRFLFCEDHNLLIVDEFK